MYRHWSLISQSPGSTRSIQGRLSITQQINQSSSFAYVILWQLTIMLFLSSIPCINLCSVVICPLVDTPWKLNTLVNPSQRPLRGSILQNYPPGRRGGSVPQYVCPHIIIKFMQCRSYPDLVSTERLKEQHCMNSGHQEVCKFHKTPFYEPFFFTWCTFLGNYWTILAVHILDII